MNNVNLDENCRCKYVDRWLDAHEKYFRVLTPVPKVPSQVQYYSEPLPFVPNNTQCAYAVLQRAMPNQAIPRAVQPNLNAEHTKVMHPVVKERNIEQLSAVGSNAVQKMLQPHIVGPNTMHPKTIQPHGVQLNEVQRHVNRPYLVVPQYAVQPPHRSNSVQRHLVQPNIAQSHVVQPNVVYPKVVQPIAVKSNLEQPNAMQANPVQPTIYASRSDLVVQPPHRVSPLKWKKTGHFHNV